MRNKLSSQKLCKAPSADSGRSIAIGAAMLPRGASDGFSPDTEPQNHQGYYPPAQTGLRGSHAGSFEIAHSLRDGTFWQNAGTPISVRESYDLVVVGAGISGLAAASFFREHAGKSARIASSDGGASCTCFIMITVGDSPVKGTRPASIS